MILADAWRHRVLYLYVLPFAILVVLFGLWPIGQSLVVAFTDSATALSARPRFVGVANFATIFADPAFFDSLRLTLVYTALSVALNIAVALAYALLLASKALGRGNLLFRLAIFLPVITPDVAGYIVWKWMYNQNFGVINGALGLIGLPSFGGIASPDTVIAALVLAELWKHVGFYTIIFVTNLDILDPEQREAALIDGANAWQRFRYVTLPQLRPAITINTIYAVIQFLKTFTVVVVMTKGGPGGATNFVSYYAYDKFDQGLYGEATAMAATLFVIVIAFAALVYWLNERRRLP